MFEQWLTAPISNLLMVVITAVGVYAAVIFYTRIAGLRSFSKMSSFDFAMTVAVGSLIATTVADPSPPLLQGIVALGAIYALQKTVGYLRRFGWANDLVDNTPVMLMRDGEVLHDNLRRTDVTESDLRSKLREANVFELSQVRAAVFETTGTISVMHSDAADATVEAWLLEGVEDAQSTPSKRPLSGSPSPAE